MKLKKTASSEAIYLALTSIPIGRVATYGQLAARAGLPGAARLVGSVLRVLPNDSQLPWHRVVNSQGRLSLPPSCASYQLQVLRLEQEGIKLSGGKINLRVYGW